jgi:hypothetical protein
VKSVAEALFTSHPYYYFLIDRDHHDAATVDQTWNDFPDPSKNNLLIWRRRELESYFIIPEYLGKSRYVKCSEAKLRTKIAQCCQEKLFLDVANAVVLEIREKHKANWVQLFAFVAGFETADRACNSLLECQELRTRGRSVSQALRANRLRKMFFEILGDYSGNQQTLSFGCGKWIERMSAKSVCARILNDCFTVPDAQGRTLQGKQKRVEIVKDLLRLPLVEQPQDFQDLAALMARQVAT